MGLDFIQKIKKSKWNSSLIKNQKLDKFLNGVFWFVLIFGTLAILIIFSTDL
jgi:hypothetical protein